MQADSHYDTAEVQPLTEEQQRVFDDVCKVYPRERRDVLLRVCYHRGFRFTDTLEKAKVYLKWRAEVNADELNLEGAVSKILTTPLLYFSCAGNRKDLDKKGRPFLVWRATDWQPSQYDKVGDVLPFMAAMVEAVLSEPLVMERGLTMVGDCSDIGWSNWDPELEKMFLNTMQHHTPLAMKQMTMHRPNWLLKILMKIVTPWLKPKLRERIVSTDSTSILEHFDADVLPELLGGALQVDWVAHQKQWFVEWQQHNAKLHADHQKEHEGGDSTAE